MPTSDEPFYGPGEIVFNRVVLDEVIWTYQEIIALKMADLQAMSPESLKKLMHDISMIWNYQLYYIWVKAQYMKDKKIAGRYEEPRLDVSKPSHALASKVQAILDALGQERR